MPWEQDVFLTPLPEPNKPQYIKDLIEGTLPNGVVNLNRGY